MPSWLEVGVEVWEDRVGGQGGGSLLAHSPLMIVNSRTLSPHLSFQLSSRALPLDMT